MNSSLMKLSSYVHGDGNKPSPEMTDFLGSKAAQLAIDADIPLPDAVVKVASTQPGLNNTHISNICWQANTEYFRKVASKRKEAGEDMVFHYPLAEPPDVTKRLNAAAQPKISFVREVDYQNPPEDFRVKEAYEGALLGAGLGALGGTALGLVGKNPSMAAAQMGGVLGGIGGGYGGNLLQKEWEEKKKRQQYLDETQRMQALKQSSYEPYSKENPIAELGEIRESLCRISENAAEKVASFEFHVEQLEGTLYDLVRQATKAQTKTAAIIDLMGQHSDGDHGVLFEMGKIARQLAEDEPVLFKHFQKTAEASVPGIPDTGHPIYDTYSDLRYVRKKLASLQQIHKTASAEAAYAIKKEQEGLQIIGFKAR